MNAVVDTPELREQYNANLPPLTAFWTELSQNEVLYDRFKALAAAPELAHWPAAAAQGGRERAARLPARWRRTGVRAKAALQGGARTRGGSLDALRRKRARRDQRVRALSSTTWRAGRRAGRCACRCTARPRQAEGRIGYKVSLQFPSYSAIVDYADDRALREQLYRAYVTRASEFGKPDWNNGPLMVELLRLRQEHAQLLGYGNFAEVSLVPKMAGHADGSAGLPARPRPRAKPYAERDMAELRAVRGRAARPAGRQPWDFTYASEKLREARYAYSEQELKQYFTEPRVLAGLFKVIETLFAVAIREDTAPIWHPDVRFFRIETTRGELSASSTSISMRATTSRAARGRTMRAAGAAAAPGSPRRCRT